MSLIIRLKSTGAKNRKQWRLVVADRRKSRKGLNLEELGFYNPLVDPPQVRINVDRYQAWLAKGARPSEAVRSLMKKLK